VYAHALAMKDVEPIVSMARAEAAAATGGVRVDLPRKLFVPANRQESSCKIVRSVARRGTNRKAISSSNRIPQVVLYIDGFGRFGRNGRCAAAASTSAVKFVCTRAQARTHHRQAHPFYEPHPG